MPKKIFSISEQNLLAKDFATIWKNNAMRSILILMPLFFALVIPVIFLVVISTTSDQSAILYVRDDIAEILPDYAKYTAKQQQYIFFQDYVSPILYIIIPAITSSVTTIFLVVGERENETISTLLNCMKAKSILKTKLFCSFINSVTISIVSFIAVSIVNSVGNMILLVPYFFNLEWLLILLLFTPVTILLCAYMSLLLTHNSGNIIHSISICGYIGAPLTLWFIGQFSGLFSISSVSFLVLSVLLIIATIIIYNVKIKHIDDVFLLGDE